MTKRVTEYRPAIEAAMHGAEGDPLSTACGSCPTAVWYRSDQLKCFCNMLKMTIWVRGMSAVSICDGREAAIARYEQELSQL